MASDTARSHTQYRYERDAVTGAEECATKRIKKTHTRTNTQAHKYTRTYTKYIHTQTQTHTHANTHTRRHTHVTGSLRCPYVTLTST